MKRDSCRQVNALLLFAVPVPSILVVSALNVGCDASGFRASSLLAPLCPIYVQRPLVAINLLFLFGCDVTFWLISLAQGSTWLIDPYWTLAPPLLAAYHFQHPNATAMNARGVVSLALMLIWALRLTHSYFRRERWQLGLREDWRYAEMRARFGRWWPLVQVFAVYAVQHAMLVGLTLPFHAIAVAPVEWRLWDTLATAVCVTGLVIAALADAQLHEHVTQGRGPPGVLRTGLWRHSRHPAHFGEQLWWWGVWMFALPCGQAWTGVGTAFNSLCMVQIMKLIEERMLAHPARRRAYQDYQRDVPLCIPWALLGRYLPFSQGRSPCKRM